MRRISLARASRMVWLINGAILLALLVGTGIALLVGWLQSLRSSDLPPTPSAALETPRRPPVIRYDPPLSVSGSSARLVLVRSGRGLPRDATGGRGGGDVVNVGFLDGAGAGRLLFDRPVRIGWITFPGAPEWLSGPLGAGGGPAILYAISDSVGAAPALYRSSLNGDGLRRLTPDGHSLVGVDSLGGDLLVMSLDPGRRQRAYSLRGDSLVPLAVLDTMEAQAARILNASEPDR